MLTQNQIRYINQVILSDASKLNYIVKENAPSDEAGLFNESSLVIWSGASDKTIFGCPKVNHAFRALHDALHLETRMNFSVESEIELGRIQASKYSSQLIQDLIYCEVSLQAMHYRDTGNFVSNQVEFTHNFFSKKS